MRGFLSRWRSNCARIVAVDPVLTARIERKHKPQHLVPEPGAGAAEFPLLIAVAADECHDPFHAGAAFAFEVLKGDAGVLFVMQQTGKPQRIFQCDRCTLAGMRTGRMRGVADQKRAAARPVWQRREIEACRHDDLLQSVDELRDRLAPTRMIAAKMAS